MITATYKKQPRQQGSVLIAYFVVLLVTVTAIAGLGTYVAQTTNMTHRRSDRIAAIQYAQGGALLSCSDLNAIVVGKSKLASRAAAKGYVFNSSSSDAIILKRTITAPFTDQSVLAEIELPNASSFTNARIVTTATKNKVTQKAAVNLKFEWLYPGAIVSTSPGTKAASVGKGTAQDGNVVVDGNKSGATVVDGGSGLAILANGRANLDKAFANIPPSSISMTNYNTAYEIPDFTAQGTSNALFDFPRFIAVANLTSNALNKATGNNHFTNLATFIKAANTAGLAAESQKKPELKYLEGVIVVDIARKDPFAKGLDPKILPYGINVKGTLFFNFDSSFGPLDKIVNTAAININPANLTGLVATNPETYPSGYPPVYYDNKKNPTNINISLKNFENIAPDEDLPALIYSVGVLDIHGPANISGICYTPSNMEIENKQDSQTQYFKGMMIMGLGIFYENNKKSTSVISYDPKTVDQISTLGNIGKGFNITYWE